VGLWTGLILLVMVAFDLSALVRYITRFTEESFAALISIIFIKEAVAKLIQVTEDAPLNLNPNVAPFYDCYCVAPTKIDPVNATNINGTVTNGMLQFNASSAVTLLSNLTTTVSTVTTEPIAWHMVPRSQCLKLGGKLEGGGCGHIADVFLMSGLLFIFTFIIAYSFKMVKTSRLFPTWVSYLVLYRNTPLIGSF